MRVNSPQELEKFNTVVWEIFKIAGNHLQCAFKNVIKNKGDLGGDGIAQFVDYTSHN